MVRLVWFPGYIDWECRKYTWVIRGHSLVPRPFPPPVFDRIPYAKTEGEGLGERVTCVTRQVDVRVDAREAVPDKES